LLRLDCWKDLDLDPDEEEDSSLLSFFFIFLYFFLQVLIIDLTMKYPIITILENTKKPVNANITQPVNSR
jgi:hypothetical protein